MSETKAQLDAAIAVFEKNVAGPFNTALNFYSNLKVAGSPIDDTNIINMLNSLNSEVLAISGMLTGVGIPAPVVVLAATVLSITPIPAHLTTDPAFTLSASSNSNAPIVYSVTAGPAKILGSTLTITGAGTIVIGASQAANSQYTAASASTFFVVTMPVPAPAPTPTPTPVNTFNPPAIPTEIVPSLPAFPNFTLGLSGDIGGVIPFGPSWYLNQKVTTNAVSSFSSLIMGAFGTNNIKFNIIPWTVIDTSKTPATYLPITLYPSESDIVNYPNGPSNAATEAGGDAHNLVFDKYTGNIYEIFQFSLTNAGTQSAGCACIWDAVNGSPYRKIGDTSTDAAGLPVLALLCKFQEASSEAGIQHALRITFNNTQTDGNGGDFIYPASHAAGTYYGNGNIPAVGMRIRLKPTANTVGLSPICLAIATCLQTFAATLADNGQTGSISIDSDPRWDMNDLANLGRFTMNDFEVVESGPKLTPATCLGNVPVVSSFTATKAANGTDVNFAFSSTGQTYAYIEGAQLVRGGSLPGGGSAVLAGVYKAGASFTLVASNQFGATTATATVA